MMEFMMARVSVCICAALIIGMMFIPVTETLMEESSEETQVNCDTIGNALDMFMSSGSEEAILFLDTYLPGSDFTLSFEGNTMILRSSERTYIYGLRNDTIPDSETYYHSDAVRLTKSDNSLRIDLMN